MCVHLCVSMLYMFRWLQKEKRAPNALELESQSIVSCLRGCWKPLRMVFSAPASTQWEPFLLLQSGFWSADSSLLTAISTPRCPLEFP